MKKLLILIICLLLCSCYDYKELNDIRIIDYVYVDYDDSYYFRLHEINNDNMIDMSLSDLDNSNDLFLGHIKYVYLSDKLCRNGINDILNYLYKNINFSNNFILLIGDDFDTDKYGLNNIDLYKHLLNDNKDIGIYNVDNDMLGYFNKDKLIGYIDDGIYKFIMFNSNYEYIDNDNIISIYDRDLKVNNGNISIKCYGTINNTDYNIYNYNELSNKISDDITNKINEYINSTLSDGSNLFGVSNNYKVNVEIILNRNGNTI